MRTTGIQPKHAQGVPYILGSRQQLATLKATARQELLDMLPSIGTVSVAELTAALGKPVDSLYDHLRILQKAGLVVERAIVKKPDTANGLNVQSLRIFVSQTRLD